MVNALLISNSFLQGYFNQLMPMNAQLKHSDTAHFDLDHAIEHIAHWLPTQGPIKDFVHHNTLHAVQNYPFHKGVAMAAKVFGARSYLPLADYQSLYQKGRITDFAIDWAVKQAIPDSSKADMLRQSLFEPDSSVHYPPESLANHGIRNSWITKLEIDLNSLAHPIVFRLLANFLDQGINRWTLPNEGERFWACIWRLANNSLLPLFPFHSAEARTLFDKTPDEVVASCLEKLVGDESLYEQYLLELLLAHPGWAGMVRLVELNPQSLLSQRLISLKELIAFELACELTLIERKKGRNFLQVCQIAHTKAIPKLADCLNSPKIPLRLKIWHEAMEFSLHSELLVAMAEAEPTAAVNKTAEIKAQALFCIDDRECSVRRYLEQLDPSIETFGAAGFFGIDFFYQGLDDAYPVAQCPNIITPKHLVVESSVNQVPGNKPKPAENLTRLHIKRHTLFRGWLFTQVLGIGYAIKMMWDVFRPGSQLAKSAKLSEVKAHTHLHLLRENDQPTPDGRLLGFSFTEMADKIENLLRNIGLTQNFAPLIVVVAHGSTSTNNPHFAAYDCGACSGKPGVPNARAFAWMANSQEVRSILRDRGIFIPDDTRFIPALHNTTRDEISYFDEHLYLMDEHFAHGFQVFQKTMEQALRKNARERCRWFELGPQSESEELSHEHVKARASSIFEPRPELNHSNNLYCVVGRRSITRNLFLDRRSFLHSYNPDTDPQGDILVKILSAVIPVCGGINLEYLFSRIDNSVYGAGTKLPHNVIGLLGVANGVEGDLRTGLPSQMIEVHEPARLLFVIDQTTDIIDSAIGKIGRDLKEWLDNEWVRLASCDPETKAIKLYNQQSWQAVKFPADYACPTAKCSEDIITGKTQTIPVHQLIGGLA